MTKYKYLVPGHIRIDDLSLYAGTMHGRRLIVSPKPIKWLEPYLIEVEGAEESTTKNKYTKEELEKMSYRKVQAIARELGLKYTGKKVEIIERILNS